MKILAMWLGLALAIAAATVVAGWWMVPLVSLAWTLAMPRRGGVLVAALSGAAAWGLLLLLVRRNGPVGVLDGVLSGTLQLPAGGAIALTLVFAGLLAGSAALVAQSIRPAVTASSRSTKY